METTILREATIHDAARVLAVLREANEPYRHRPNGPSGPFHTTVADIASMMATVPVVVATVDGVVVGCLFFVQKDEYLQLANLAVLPRYQRRGIGRALITEGEARAHTQGLLRTRLGVRRAMPENRRYYEGLGYRVVEETEANLTMEKWLSVH